MKIKSEADAWKVLSAIMRNERVDRVEFDGWPILDITIRGDDYKASLNSGQMAALVEIERVFGRAYSVVAHGAYDMRRLKDDESDDLQFTTRVKEGSTILQTDFTPLVKAFAGAVAANPQFSIGAAVVLGLVFVSRPVIMKYYENRAKQLDFDEKKMLLDAVKLGREDIEKTKLLESAVRRVEEVYPQFAQVVPDAREAFWRFASSSVDADTLLIEGIEFSQEDLEMLAARRTRRQGDVKRVVEIFQVTAVKKSGDSYIIGLRGKKISLGARFRKPQLTDARLRKLTAIMTRDAKIEATLEVRVVDKAALSGRLLGFKEVAEDK